MVKKILIIGILFAILIAAGLFLFGYSGITGFAIGDKESKIFRLNESYFEPLSPKNNYAGESPIIFSFQTWSPEDTLINCNFTLNEEINQTFTNISSGDIVTFNLDLNLGEYSWALSCWKQKNPDITNTSNTYNLSVINRSLIITTTNNKESNDSETVSIIKGLSTSSGQELRIFGDYDENLEILSNYVRLYSSEYGANNELPGNLLDGMYITNYTTTSSKTWNDTTTLTLNFIFPDKTGHSTENYSVDYLRFRCADLNKCPDKYDVWADGNLILDNGTSTASAINTWVNVDVPDTNLTYAGGNFTIVIESVQGSGAQQLSVSDIEIISTEKLNYSAQSSQTGYLGISQWWNNLQWAHSLLVPNINNSTAAVNRFGSVMNLTIGMWENEGLPDYGNVSNITAHGHEYATRGDPFTSTHNYDYDQGIDWAIDTKNWMESNISNMSRWTNNTVLSFSYPNSKTNFHVTEALYDTGFRIGGNIGNLNETKTTGWEVYTNRNGTRDELDWMHIHSGIGDVNGSDAQFSDGTFESKWNWLKNNGYFGQASIGRYGVFNETYTTYVANDNTSWRCTWGEARSYYYYYQHANVTYNSSASTSTSKVYDVHIHYENTADQSRIWKVPITFGFNLAALNLESGSVETYLQNTLNLSDINSSQSMQEGYYLTGNTLYLSVKKNDGEQIIISGDAVSGETPPLDDSNGNKKAKLSETENETEEVKIIDLGDETKAEYTFSDNILLIKYKNTNQVISKVNVTLKPSIDLPEEIIFKSKVEKPLEIAKLFDIKDKTIMSGISFETNIKDKDIESAVIELKVPIIMLTDMRMDKNSIAVLRGDAVNGIRDADLKVTEVNRDENYAYYQVTTPGFSQFLMFGKPVPILMINIKPLQLIIGIKIMLVTLHLGAIYVFIKKKGVKKKKKRVGMKKIFGIF